MNEHLDIDTLYRLLDGELDPSAARAAESHVWRCQPCRALRDECGAVSSALRWYGGEPPSPPEEYWEGFWQRLPLDSVSRRPGAVRYSPRRLVPALAAAAVAAWILATVSTGPREPVHTSSSVTHASVAIPAEWADDYDLFQQTTIAIGSVDPISKGIALASLAQAP